MTEGGFELRSWVSNCPELTARFESDGRQTQHTSDFEKVLGYHYQPKSDAIYIAQLDFAVCMLQPFN